LASDPKKIYFIGSETLRSTSQAHFNEHNIPFYSSSNGYKKQKTGKPIPPLGLGMLQTLQITLSYSGPSRAHLNIGVMVFCPTKRTDTTYLHTCIHKNLRSHLAMCECSPGIYHSWFRINKI